MEKRMIKFRKPMAPPTKVRRVAKRYARRRDKRAVERSLKSLTKPEQRR